MEEERKNQLELKNEALKKDPHFINFSNEIIEYLKKIEEKNNLEFKKSLKSVKHILKQRGLILPKDWNQVFIDWYIESLPEKEQHKLSIPDLYKKISDETILIQWAEEYSKIITPNRSEKLSTKEKHKGFAVRFTLLKMLGFEKTPEFLALSEGQKVAFLRFILGCDESTAKGLKNGYEKVIQPKHEEEAKELFNKIKKGDIL